MSEPLTASDILADAAFPELKEHVVRTTGLAYIADRDADLAQRLHRRLAARGCRTCGEYLRHLRAPGSDAEQEALVQELTIGETYFFRFQEQFDALRERVIPQLLERNRESRRLRIWSAGCATGPEPYTLSILLREEFGAALRGWDVEILGTDLNTAFLRQADAGSYGEWALRSLPATRRASYFARAGNEWTVRAPYREWVRFQPHNLVEHPFPPPAASGLVDLILCRNVMIYFDQATIQQVIRRFAAALTEGGWLVIGHAEMTADVESILRPVQAGQVVFYQKAPVSEVSGQPPVPPPIFALPRGAAPKPAAPSPAHIRTRKAVPARPASSVSKQPADLSQLRALADRGDWRAAADCGRRLVEAEPLNADAQFYLALVLESAGESEAAEQSLRRAVYLQRSHALAHYHLGRLLTGRKGAGAGRKALENALHAVSHLPDDAPLAGGELTAGELRRAVDAQMRAEASR